MKTLLFEEKGIEYYKICNNAQQDCERLEKKYAEEICALESECFKDAWSLKNICSQLEKENSATFIAMGNGKIIGASCIDYIFDEAELLRIAVTEKARKRGIAGNLMRAVFYFTMEKGVCNIFLEVRQDNMPAINLYLKSGFEKISVRKNYYGDCDGIIMKCCKMTEK